MIKNTILTKGLIFSIKNLSSLRESKAVLKKDTDNNIILHFYYSGSYCIFTEQEKEHFCKIEFIFPDTYLEIYFSSHPESYHAHFKDYAEKEICCSKQMILHEIINCKYQGAYLEMFLESKALELLLCFQKCTVFPMHDCASCKFLMRPLEKNKILRAKEIILERIDNPPTIHELSLEVGINQCYLKKGFKEMFDATIYEFVQQQRVAQAKLMLATTEISIAEIANHVGFSSTSNFSSTFKRHTGVFPSELRKSLNAMT